MQHQFKTQDLREKFLAFFESKGHARIPSAPLVPENDPSVLFTTAGMHPLVPYFKGESHPQGTRLTDAQKCLRTTDIDEVGDATHATVFEMLGNWSLGDYFKQDAIAWSWEFLTSKDWLGLDPAYLAVSVFAGDNDSPRDEESFELWRSQGVPESRIAFLGKEDNWWPAGGGHPGPQGPDTEMFYWTGSDTPPETFDPTDKQWVEIWNDVFMQYDRSESGTYTPLPQQNVDTGMGLERTIMILNGLTSIYEIDSYATLMEFIASVSIQLDVRHQRIIADHIKAATFLLGDEAQVTPSNSDQGYILRRLIRRAIRSARVLGVEDVHNLLQKGSQYILEEYGDFYTSLRSNQARIAEELEKETTKFEAALTRGMREFERITQNNAQEISGKDAFTLYESFGFPLELTQELASEKGVSVDVDGFQKAFEAHQEKSRVGAEQKFKGGLVDHSPESIKYHTATHLLHQALRDVLGDHVFQKGSNITPERLRFDFSHPDKMTDEQKQAVEHLVNEKIQAALPVVREEMTVQEAKEKGALGLFEERYGEKVSVYSVGDYSCEICGGPHVQNTKELGMFKLVKEESAGSGVRRIKAILE